MDENVGMNMNMNEYVDATAYTGGHMHHTT